MKTGKSAYTAPMVILDEIDKMGNPSMITVARSRTAAHGADAKIVAVSTPDRGRAWVGLAVMVTGFPRRLARPLPALPGIVIGRVGPGEIQKRRGRLLAAGHCGNDLRRVRRDLV